MSFRSEGLPATYYIPNFLDGDSSMAGVTNVDVPQSLSEHLEQYLVNPENFQAEIETEKSIPEDSVFRKLLTCIPFIGVHIAFINDCSLDDKIKVERDPKREIRFFQIKNEYCSVSIVRHSITFTMSVSLLAVGILYSNSLLIVLPVFAIGVSIIAIGIHCYRMHLNKQAIIHLRKQLSHLNRPSFN